MAKAELGVKSVDTKLTEAEYARLEAAAKASGETLAEWIREVLLARVSETPATPGEETVLAEVLGLRTILLNLFYKLAKGEAITEAEMQEVIDRADAVKLPKACERLEAAAKKFTPAGADACFLESAIPKGPLIFRLSRAGPY